ncbi:MAG: hypothetical protein ABH871_03840 [Pseudomonadota bacterium]
MEGMMMFHQLFPDIGLEETRTIAVFKEQDGLPEGSYGFVELYCIDPNCDCRRVMFNVVSEEPAKHLATINHAFEPPPPDDVIKEQSFLDELNVQSEYSTTLLKLFKEVLLMDTVYIDRLEEHYKMVKTALKNPTHKIWKVIKGANKDYAGENLRSNIKNIDPYSPCICGSGNKFKWCCREKMMCIDSDKRN